MACRFIVLLLALPANKKWTERGLYYHAIVDMDYEVKLQQRLQDVGN